MIYTPRAKGPRLCKSHKDRLTPSDITNLYHKLPSTIRAVIGTADFKFVVRCHFAHVHSLYSSMKEHYTVT